MHIALHPVIGKTPAKAKLRDNLAGLYRVTVLVRASAMSH